MPMPPEYEGGFEKEYVEALKTFVENGGIVMPPNKACDLAAKELEAPSIATRDRKVERGPRNLTAGAEKC
jgi:hypothetical protein